MMLPGRLLIAMQPGYALRNPLADLLSDEVYELLERHHLLDPKGVRDYELRARFKDLRAQHLSAGEAIEQLREEHPYLQFDTIRKIVYRAA
jgi:hypothetical protein